MSNEVTFTNKNATNWDNYLPDKQTATRVLGITAYVAAILAITGLIVISVIDGSMTSERFEIIKKGGTTIQKWLPGFENYENNVFAPLFVTTLTLSMFLPLLIGIPEIYKRVRKRNTQEIKPLAPTETFEKAAISRQHQICRKALFAVALVVITVSAALLFYNYLVQSSSSFQELKRLQDISSVETVVKNMEIGGWCGLIGGGGLAALGFFSSTLLEKIRLKFCQREAEASLVVAAKAEKEKL